MGKYTNRDVARETESSRREVSAAHHQAKDDAAKEGGWGVPENRHDSGGSGSRGNSSSSGSSGGDSGK